MKKALKEARINYECDLILSVADKSHLQLEVIWSAFKHKEQFPSASLLECLQVGAKEWDIVT